jgi:hypothetical protein
MTESAHLQRRTGIAVVAAVILLLSAGILARNGSVSRATPIYQADAMVLQNHAHGPQLCLGAIPAVYPPMCGTIAITNWEWSNVSGGAHLPGVHLGHVPPRRVVRRNSLDAQATSHRSTGSFRRAANGDHHAVPRSGGWMATAEPPDLAGRGGALPGWNQ